MNTPDQIRNLKDSARDAAQSLSIGDSDVPTGQTWEQAEVTAAASSIGPYSVRLLDAAQNVTGDTIAGVLTFPPDASFSVGDKCFLWYKSRDEQPLIMAGGGTSGGGSGSIGGTQAYLRVFGTGA